MLCRPGLNVLLDYVRMDIEGFTELYFLPKLRITGIVPAWQV